MFFLKRIYIVLITCIALLYNIRVFAQENIITTHYNDSLIFARQQEALYILNKEDTLAASALWPNIKPVLFFSNVRNNILYPSRINQGASTNFCSYAALTHLLLKYYPNLYVQYILNLYHSGETKIFHKTLKPSGEIKQAAGALKNKARLDILHADQLWFLTLSDQFKGYMNFIDHRYHPGDENKVWAGTNYGKFNRMIKDFTDDELEAVGSDFLRPFKNDFYEYITEQLNEGVVVLYVNSKWLYPHRFTLLKLRAPTHFIVLYRMYQVGDMIEIQYWDYGMKTEQLITRKRLKQLIFGITTIK